MEELKETLEETSSKQGEDMNLPDAFKTDDMKKTIRDGLLQQLHIGFGQGQYPIEEKIYVADDHTATITFVVDKDQLNDYNKLCNEIRMNFINLNHFKIKTNGVEEVEFFEDDLNGLNYTLKGIDFKANPHVEIDETIAEKLGLQSNIITIVKMDNN